MNKVFSIEIDVSVKFEMNQMAKKALKKWSR